MFMDIYHLDEVLQDLSMFMTFDVGHAFTYGFEENEMYTPRVKHVHIHDNNGDDDSHYTLGEGSIDFNRVFNIYDEKGYDGTYIIEANDTDSLKNSMEYLKTNFSQIHILHCIDTHHTSCCFRYQSAYHIFCI